MASSDYDPTGRDLPPPRPTTPPVRRGFLRVLAALVLITALAYGVPFAIDRAGYAWESGRSRAAAEALARLDDAQIIERSSLLFRMATQVITPAVVNIRTTIAGQVGAQGLGSGVIIDGEKGYIVTNEHVVRDAAEIVVRIGRSTEVAGSLIGVDERTDLAVLQVKGPVGSAAAWGDSSKAEVGDWVLAVGSPFALDRTVTAGIISATGRHGLGRADAYEDYLQTDAAINPGNSGGPLIDLRGRVIGINTALFNPTKEGQGIGLAISSEIASKVADQIIRNGKVVRAYLGIVSDRLSPGLAKELGLPPDQEGALVTSVRPESPAGRAGLLPRDVVVGLDGRDVTDPASLRARAFTLPIGSEVPVEVYRGGQRRTIRVAVAAMPEPVAANPPGLGFELAEVPPDRGGGLAVVRVAPGSPAQAAGMREGMRIIAVGRNRVRTRGEFEAAVSQGDPSQGIPLGIDDGSGRVVFLTLAAPGTLRP